MDQGFLNGEGRSKKYFTQREVEMKKAICIFFAVLVLLSVNTLTAYADGRGDHHGSGHFHGSRYHFSGGVWIGPGWSGWGPWWWGAPGYPYYPYYPYYSPPVVIQQQPPVYVQPAPQPEEQSYWYYCPNPQGYYPYVKQCPKGWLKVIPPVPQDGEE